MTLLCASTVIWASENPVSVTAVGFTNPATVGIGTTATYTLKNNLPFPTLISKVLYTTEQGDNFTITDNCSGVTLAASTGTCVISILLTP